MYKLALLSIVWVALLVPLFLSSDENPRRGLVRSLSLIAVFNLAYALVLIVGLSGHA